METKVRTFNFGNTKIEVTVWPPTSWQKSGSYRVFLRNGAMREPAGDGDTLHAAIANLRKQFISREKLHRELEAISEAFGPDPEVTGIRSEPLKPTAEEQAEINRVLVQETRTEKEWRLLQRWNLAEQVGWTAPDSFEFEWPIFRLGQTDKSNEAADF